MKKHFLWGALGLLIMASCDFQGKNPEPISALNKAELSIKTSQSNGKIPGVNDDDEQIIQINGKQVVSDHNPVAAENVNLFNGTSIIETVKVDEEGKFVFDVPRGQYHMEVGTENNGSFRTETFNADQDLEVSILL